MPTARELLEQAGVLMRRNRPERGDAEIPVLTDMVEDAVFASTADVVIGSTAGTVKAPDAIVGANSFPDEAIVVDDSITDLSRIALNVSPEQRDADSVRWAELERDLRMQVLQRIDILADTGLQGELRAKLQPIVDRASADLIATINQHVGELLRTSVTAELEREIEKWRKGR